MAIPRDPEDMMRFLGMFDALKDWQKALLEKTYKSLNPKYIVDPSKIDPDPLNFPKPGKAVFGGIKIQIDPSLPPNTMAIKTGPDKWKVVEMGGMAAATPKKPKCDCPGCAGLVWNKLPETQMGQAIRSSNPSAVIEKRTGHGQYTGGPNAS